MNEGLIARRYATAMLKVARERGTADVLYEKMKLFEQNYISHPDLHRALLNPVLSAADKEALLTTAIGIEAGELYVKGIQLLIRNHREMYIRSICLMYQSLYRKAFGISRVKIITAATLRDDAAAKLRKLVTDHTDRRIEFVERVDPSLIGGFVVRVNSMQLDASIRRELRDLRMKMK